jgi:hypothetical protein
MKIIMAWFSCPNNGGAANWFHPTPSPVREQDLTAPDHAVHPSFMVSERFMAMAKRIAFGRTAR